MERDTDVDRRLASLQSQVSALEAAQGIEYETVVDYSGLSREKLEEMCTLWMRASGCHLRSLLKMAGGEDMATVQ
jgi:hypothetical protein